MTFLSPERLLLLAVVGALLAGYLVVQRQRRRYAVRFTNVELLASVAPRRPGWRRHVPAGLSLLGLALLVTAFARPTWPVQVPRERATVMLAVDVSLSMAATDVAPTRLEAAQDAASQFTRAFPRRFQLGLVSFSRSARIEVPPTHNRARVVRALRNLALDQSTAIGEGIFASLDAIETEEESRQQPNQRARKVPSAIILLSDGSTNAGRANSVAAEAAREAGVPVSTIAYGTDGGTVEVGGRLISVPVDRDALRQIAQTTGGRFATAESAEELQGVYDDLGSSIGYRSVQREVTPWFVGIALGFGALAAATALLWTSRLP